MNHKHGFEVLLLALVKTLLDLVHGAQVGQEQQQQKETAGKLVGRQKVTYFL
jgi:hypothetical protein